MKLRKTIQKIIYEKLDSSCFTSNDFLITFDDTEQIEPLINITFLHDESYYIDVFFDEGIYFATMVPGEIKEKESIQLQDFDEVINYIPHWANEVRRELQVNHEDIENIDGLKEIIKEHLENQGIGQEFSVTEINQLQEKFKELERRISQLEKDNIITSSQLNELKKDIKQISTDVEYYPKYTWLKTASNKILKILINIGKSQEGRKIITDSARKFLGLE